MSIRKAFAVSLGMLMIGAVGSLTVFLTKCVWVSYTKGYFTVSNYIVADFRRALDYGIPAILPGMLGLTLTACWFLVQRLRQPS